MRASTAILLFCGCLIWGCADDRHPYARFEPPSTAGDTSGAAIYGVVEIPAGTTVLRRLDTLTGAVEVLPDQSVDFLPYPANFGFIARTIREGSPLPALILMHALAPESAIAVTPVAVLQMRNATGPYDVIVCIPEDPGLQSIKVTRFADFITDYNPARHILQEWMLNHMGFGTFELVGWQDERFAQQLIERHRLPAE
ncbi:MAG: inorganic diphosphatase [Saprospiraceae bacterium]|nr:inorganic diphosphatase [Saprospiraceae bacterium]